MIFMKMIRAALHPTGEDLLISTSAGLALPPPKPRRVHTKSARQTADSRDGRWSGAAQKNGKQRQVRQTQGRAVEIFKRRNT